MDVSLWNSRLLIISLLGLIGLLSLSACGNRFDLSTERGRQSRIDEANFHLSRGECAQALEAINHVFYSSHVTEEVRLVKASAHACAGTYNMLALIANLSGASNYFSTLAKSLSNIAGDGAPNSFYIAVDTLTQDGAVLDASQRSKQLNTYMVFLQLGVVGSILRNYGDPDSSGAQGTDLIYNTGGSPAGEMSDVDACALVAALSAFSDSFTYSSLTDADTAAVNNQVNALCVSAGVGSCSSLNRSRTACDGTNAASVAAQAVVGGINSAW
jgi:hypothetical protein